MTSANMLFFTVLAISMMFHCSNAQITEPNLPFEFTIKENVKASLSIMMIAFFSALAFMGIFSLYLHHCSYDEYRQRHRNPIAAAAELCRGGFNRHVIDKCPILMYSMVKDLKIGKGALECAVCLNEFEDDDEIRLLPKCHHVFHPHCIDVWLLSHMNCPVCRARLTSDITNIAIATPMLTSNTENNPTMTAEAEAEAEAGRGHETEDQEEEQSSMVMAEEPITVLTHTATSCVSTITLDKLMRSHSTGHSLVEPQGNVQVVDRHTLRLPEHVRKQILVNHESVRGLAKSNVVLLPSAWSLKRTWFRFNNNNDLEQWSSMTPPFVSSGNWGETTCWTPLRMSFYKTGGHKKPSHILPV